ncbi:MAG: endonuclease/exonuclease/phosphatase family protein [Acidobacteriota bacterium]|nr:endonuclease/exonuclease/phosphatase family protein [Acidobacteriota bacterium]
MKNPVILDHDLQHSFPDLLKFESTMEMESSEIYHRIKPEVERILYAVVQEDLSESFAVADGLSLAGETSGATNIDLQPPANAGGSDKICALAWNIERGSRFEGIIESLKNHDGLKDKDVLLLTELDYGMARSENRFVAQELARELKLNYAFAPVYIALQKGSGVESQMEGENTKSIHGLALFSKYPMKNVHAIPLPNGKDKMWGKEKRLGHLRALFADIAHPAGEFRAVTIHLDAHCSRAHRHLQMKIILDHLDTLSRLPALIGGDWNTTTFNAQNATRAILSYWRRVLMGVKNVVKNHYPYPDRYFERLLFNEIESRGYDYKNLNETGVGTIHYDVESVETNTNLRDWVPEWCMPFIFWAARRVGGRVSGRLDWFAGKDIAIAPGTKPRTIGNLTDHEGIRLSDHDAITLDFTLSKR